MGGRGISKGDAEVETTSGNCCGLTTTHATILEHLKVLKNKKQTIQNP